VSFIHEDSAQIILSLKRLPAAGMTVTELARDMVTTNDLRNLPSPNEPAFHLANPDKQQAASLG